MTLVRRDDGARRDVLSLYATAPPSVRAHVRVRWSTCPFRAVAAQLPASGRILEVGCGHGLLTMLAALASRARTARGVDVDERKVEHARAAAARAREQGADCTVDIVPAGRVPAGPWDAIAIVDVLYLLSAGDQRRLLHSCARQLGPGGVLVVKEMALAPRWKARWNAVQETTAVRVLGITSGKELVFLDPALLAEWMAADGLEVRHLPLHHGYPHPHHLVLARRPQRPVVA